jgi:PilZ domain
MGASPMLARADRRSGVRVRLSRRAVLRCDGKAAEVEIEDLTCDGCRIKAPIDLPPSSRVSIGLAGIGHTPAYLVWRSGDLYGCAFEQRLPPAAVAVGFGDNVAYLPETTEAPLAFGDGDAKDSDAKLSLRARVGIIAGLSLLSWSAIFGVVALLL